LSIAAQNVNSLNISSSISDWELKVNTIMRINADLIFLLDLHLKRKDGCDITNNLRTALLKGTGRKYDMWENSNKNQGE
jgi:response regulator of citrate/malate metabolism